MLTGAQIAILCDIGQASSFDEESSGRNREKVRGTRACPSLQTELTAYYHSRSRH
jgi:hypothetical protein